MQTRKIFLMAAIACIGGIGITLRGAEEKAAGEKPGAGAIPAESGRKVPPALNFKVKDIDGNDLDLGSYQGKVLLLVNVASKCGLTDKQYAGLEGLYRKYKEKGFEILAFPANNFGSQEPGNEAEIKKFCTGKGVSFKLFAKISVKGDDIHPLYKFLTSKETSGPFAGDIKWNFQKFLVDADGKVISRFDPAVDPLSKGVVEAVEKALKQVRPQAEKGT